jgi:hypothetical protein
MVPRSTASVTASTHPGPRLPEAALGRVRARQATGLQLQTPGVLPVVRRCLLAGIMLAFVKRSATLRTFLCMSRGGQERQPS